MPYKPNKGDRAIFLGPWYDYDILLNFLVTLRSTDISVRRERSNQRDRLNAISIHFKTTDTANDDKLFVSEFEGDWLSKFTSLREFLTLRATNKGNVKTKGQTTESDDSDLSSDEILSFWKNTEVMINELKGFDFVYDTDDFNNRFNLQSETPAPTET